MLTIKFDMRQTKWYKVYSIFIYIFMGILSTLEQAMVSAANRRDSGVHKIPTALLPIPDPVGEKAEEAIANVGGIVDVYRGLLNGVYA